MNRSFTSVSLLLLLSLLPGMTQAQDHCWEFLPIPAKTFPQSRTCTCTVYGPFGVAISSDSVDCPGITTEPAHKLCISGDTMKECLFLGYLNVTWTGPECTSTSSGINIGGSGTIGGHPVTGWIHLILSCKAKCGAIQPPVTIALLENWGTGDTCGGDPPIVSTSICDGPTSVSTGGVITGGSTGSSAQ